MEKKTPTEILVQFTDPERDCYSVADIIQAMHEYAAQQLKPLQERIDELEGALKGMYSPLEVAAIAEAAYNTGSAVQEFNINHYLKHQQ